MQMCSGIWFGACTFLPVSDLSYAVHSRYYHYNARYFCVAVNTYWEVQDMKVVVVRSSGFAGFILRKIFKIKKEEPAS